jgi:hypothetical protein
MSSSSSLILTLSLSLKLFFSMRWNRKNLILTFVKEERLIDPSDYKYRVNDHDDDNVDDNDDGILRKKKVVRFISQAMIPGSQLVKVEIAKSKLKEDQQQQQQQQYI